MNIEQLVSKAKQVCDNRGARFTPIREKVFRLLAAKQGGVGAYDLLEELKLTESSAKPATVYRALDFLSELGFIHKIESTNAFMLCHHFDCIHPVQLLICDSCGHVQELHSNAISHELNNLAAEHGFLVKAQTIEAHGRCGKCNE
ncbi:MULTISPECIES: transcriptional repressor [Pseudoalteromonas]|uniref:Ferric uptake regulation protein n=2 Tax=Pseudoalteromonas TaxID=53246 RepID=A0A0F4QNC7_9GAMM|nr:MULTISPECIES: transcriptional repressor [Pseudoalteromonas]KJZ09198.1 XRE family transcriptional regulator [Pseudoalteromonas rubra]MCF2910318.1 transcriptional repressor [Pseudoalteromonas sp. DL2-H2.2]QTL36756.1 transcriptional repressor [Pseudoalteromonas viridis]RZM83597.1 transcriptional repressor [Pseudoalteromonas rubra]